MVIAVNLKFLIESNKYNYLAYLLADNNSTSIKLAKYFRTSHIDLIENNEYAHVCLIPAAKQVLDLLINDPAISWEALSEIIDINLSAIQKHIDALKQKGVISRESETTGFWEIHINKQADD